MNVAQRRQLRAARKAKEQGERARRQRTNRLLTVGVIVAVVGVVVAWMVWAGSRPPIPGVDFPTQPATHIGLTDRHPAYNSNPPTSGWHYPAPAAWGEYSQVLPDEEVVHNLEHGGIWISYRNVNDTELINKLEAILRRYPTKVIITPRPANDSPIAVAAWGHLLNLDQYDEAKILAFIDAYRNRGPEDVP